MLSAEVTCIVCKEEFLAVGARPRLQRYCSKECRNKVLTERHKKYVEKNQERVRQYNVEQHNQRKAVWGWGGDKHVILKRRDSLEREIKAITILEKLGFSDILHMAPINVYFSGDYIATKDNRNCIVELTTGYTHPIKRHRDVCRRLGLDLYIIFIKTDLSYYVCKKVDLDKVKVSVCLLHDEIMQSVKEKVQNI